ncbi:MAG: DUF1015 domain-containing protein [Chitinophagaceae bacterium]|jgi:uncharacterized protein (DUF1015 family)|nr:DUF1015 domain-containing protein [Chitinophagaceae bacterium]MBK7680127.1 DUF1015 domain-containing protein [Chitinophagaceae bacterium]MBK8301087.1 DUF1015 domain-containing protein [Chitinophagaceae bacterium]MBK9465497.1 DUF1015 domain-containing protein [Chitinophagaceae bacterium]MBK9660759.1 DUF1015 domain-containing protein [Chitinophagaceae bacterium]
MAIIKPFQSLRPQPELAQQVASRPYDVLNSEEARAEAKDNPFSFLHVTKSEIDLPDDIDTHSTAVYEKAKENLQQLIQNGILLKEEKSCYYIYQLVMNGRSQTGLVCVSSVEDYFNDVIKKHEFTRPEKEKDRIDHMRTIEAQTGNVFMAYRDVMKVNALIDGWKTTNKPVYDFTASDGIQHSVWVVDRDIVVNSITELFKTEVPATYIADGHHRAASAAKVSKQLADSADAKYFLTTIFPASQLAILDYNRVIKDLHGLTGAKLISRLQDDFFITLSVEPVKPSQLHEFGMYMEGQWYILTSRKGTYSEDPIGVLDITILSNNILEKLLGIKDQRTDKRIDFVGGIRGLSELEKRVNSGEMKVAFSLYPVTIEQLFDIADAGKVMPPKSTWFEPKLRDGLLTHLI